MARLTISIFAAGFIALGAAPGHAQFQSYTTTPDGFGGSWTTGPNGFSVTTTPDGFGGSFTFVNPGYRPVPPSMNTNPFQAPPAQQMRPLWPLR